MKKNSMAKKAPSNDLNAGNAKKQQNKDALDSRSGEEQLFKGNDITHNRKEKKSENKK